MILSARCASTAPRILKGCELMRRADREVTNRSDILDIMRRCTHVSLALMDGDYPYVIELNFGFEDAPDGLVLYFHGAHEGKKLALIAANPHAAFSMSCGHEFVPGKVDCAGTFKYESVCGRGLVQMVEGAEKQKALSIITSHYDPAREHPFEEKHARAVSVFKLNVEQFTGKRRLVK